MSIRDLFSDLSGPVLTDPDPVRRAQIQMKQPLPKRFYKHVTIGNAEGGFSILLDDRPVKTPGKHLLAVPTLPAAKLLAQEWQDQLVEIDPVKMPVTRLVNTAIEGVAPNIDAVFNDIVNFAGTDLLCYRAEHPQSLLDLQAQHWDPVIYWAADKLGARFILAQGVIHREQPAEAIRAYSATLKKYCSALELAALHTMTTLTGSALLSLAFAERRLSVEESWEIAHVDEDWNRLQWGSDAEAEARRKTRWIEMKAATELFDTVQ